MPLLCLCCGTASMAQILVHKFVARWQQHRFIMRVFLFTLTNVSWQVGNFLFKWVSLRNSSMPPTLCVLILLIFQSTFHIKVEKYQKVFSCPLYLHLQDCRSPWTFRCSRTQVLWLYEGFSAFIFQQRIVKLKCISNSVCLSSKCWISRKI